MTLPIIIGRHSPDGYREHRLKTRVRDGLTPIYSLREGLTQMSQMTQIKDKGEGWIFDAQMARIGNEIYKVKCCCSLCYSLMSRD